MKTDALRLLLTVSLFLAPPLVAPLSSGASAQDRQVYFIQDVTPLLDSAGCSSTKCHGAAAGKGGFKLSMFGAEPELDHEFLTRGAEGRWINHVEPAASLFLQKVTNSAPHPGGAKFAVDSPQHRLLVSWIAQGARLSDPQSPTLLSVTVAPEKQILQKGETHKLTATAVYSDGTTKDVTAAAGWRCAEDSVATVDATGAITAVGFGQTPVTATYLRKPGLASLVVPQPLPTPFPEMAANNKIDELVLAKLRELGIPPSQPCSDAVFLRRVYLDVTGTLPTPDQARAFLADGDAAKRAKLIDELLAGDEFATYWALKWGDLLRVKSEYPSNLWPNAVQAYHRWIKHSIEQNKPYDQFARELITSSGSNFRNPPVNFYRAFLTRSPQNLSEVTALIFMGARVGCARCHAHPTEDWTLDDNVHLAAFFAPVRYKATREWKEEIVYVNPRQTMLHPRTSEVAQPKFLGGDLVELEPGEDPRVRFAQWLTAPENPWFARNIVNRTWFWLLGRGIVHEVDDLRPTNPPENPQLLKYLETELVSHGYDLKHVYRLILNSQTYQLSAKANEFNQHDVAHFSHYQVKRLGAETLLDAIGQVTERWDTYRSTIPEPFVVMPTGYRATHLADGSIDLPFLQLFGRPPRDTAYESDRDLRLSLRQTLHLLNSSDVQNKINASLRLRTLIQEVPEDPKVIEELFLATMSRFPTPQEVSGIQAYMSGEGKSIPEATQAEQTAAEEALATVKASLAPAVSQHEAAETAAKEAQTTADGAKAAAASAAGALTNTQNVAAAKRQAADQAKKTLDDLLANQQKPSQVKLATAAQAVTDAAAAKAALDQPLAEATAATAAAQQALDAAETAAAAAAAAAKAVGEGAGKSEEEKKQAADLATAKRRAADDAKAALTSAQQNEQQARTQVTTAAQKLAEAEAGKKAAEEALAAVNGQVTAATTAHQGAENAAVEAAPAAAAAKAEADKTTAAQTAADADAAQKRKLADEAKAARDKLTADETAATAKLAEANKKVAAATTAMTPSRNVAMLDLVWALMNTKEFVFNH